MDQIVGYIERITFQNAENGYTVAKMQEPKKRDLTCVVGVMPSIVPGETIRCFGAWKRHLVHGMQFEVEKYSTEAPADLTGIQKYLGSGLIKGIGPVYAAKIVDCFKEDTLAILDECPERLLEISGLGEKRVAMIQTCWDEQRSIREVMIFLQAHDVSTTYAQKIYKTYKGRSLQILQENPYSLAKDIFGIGFKTADRIAEKLGMCKNSPQRIDAGIEFVLSELSSEGHVCFPRAPFLEAAGEILEVEPGLITARLDLATKEDRIVLRDLVSDSLLTPFVWHRALFNAETGITREVHRLIRGASSLRDVDRDKALEWVQEKLNLSLGQKQQQAVATALVEKMQIITGGPGTGKSTITNAILCITEKLTRKIVLAAPTGKAAKRMTEITGKKAQTIHSLLEYDFKERGFKRNRESPLDCDLIIVDESSMIDTLLMNSLLKAIPTTARVIFVGDINQLPSVGPGNVLKDMIASRTIPVTMLDEIFRQAQGSQIVTSAHLINQGMFPDIRNLPESDFFFIEGNEPEEALNKIIALVTQRIPQKYRYDPINEIQVLAPMKKGALGTENLNAVLQETLNPSDAPLIRFGKKLHVGDKVMQIRNNYDKGVFNGDVGRIKKIDQTEHAVKVLFDEKEVDYDFADLDELVLAYAVSIHKYQGSECPAIVIPVHTCHYKLLHRNLLYTGVTRGKKLVVLVGSKKAIGIAVRNDEVKRRYTGLKQSLLDALSSLPHTL